MWGCAFLPGSLDSTQLDALVITGGVLEKQVMHNIEFNLEDNSLIPFHNIRCPLDELNDKCPTYLYYCFKGGVLLKKKRFAKSHICKKYRMQC